MPTPSWITQIKQVLPEATREWVISALKQEPLVWYSLQDPAFLTRAIEFSGASPISWSPGMLAILSLGLPARVEWYKCEPISVLDSDLRQQAAKAFESLTKGEIPYNFSQPAAQKAPSWYATQGLPKAGLL